MAAPRVSVVIPTHNRAALVVRAAESVLSQTMPDLELVVIDDASTDDTPARLAPLTSDPRLRVLTRATPTGSAAAARNAGIAEARGELIAFLDSDDRWFPTKLAEQLAHLDAHPSCALVSSRLQFVGAADHVWPEAPQKPLSYDDLVDNNQIACSLAMVRAPVLRETGAFDASPELRFGEDWDLWLRIAQHHEFAVLPRIHGEYLVHEGGVSHERLRRLEGEIAVLERLCARDPSRAAQVRGRLAGARRSLAAELWSVGRRSDALLARLGRPYPVDRR